MSGDGGGFFNVNSAHPFENPNALSNVIEIVLMLLIPTAFIQTFGRMVGDHRQSLALLAVAGLLFAAGLGAASAAEHVEHNTVPAAVGAATEGTETRFGVAGSASFGAAATASADGAANSSYDSFTSLGGGVLMANMLLAVISPGGAGSGLYGLLMISMLAAFIGGLMVGRTPEFLRKRLGAREMKFIRLYIIMSPTVILVGTGHAVAPSTGRASMLNTGPHGLSEVLLAFTSAANSNGSAFAGISANSPFYNTALGIAMLLGRYLPLVLVLALAGSLAAKPEGVRTVGTLRTHTPVFVTLVAGTALIVVGLEFLPALALAPLAETR
jgi:potassium-transporting ATPase potassium-binding subunit